MVNGQKKRFFLAICQKRPRETLQVPERHARFNEDEQDLSADPDAAHAPAKAVPEALPLPVAGAGRRLRIGRGAVLVVALRRIVLARAVVIAGAVIIVLRSDRAADDGAADQPGRDARGNAAL